ncbi:MAG: transcriptional regulator NrdR [Huintestinicola sp.]
MRCPYCGFEDTKVIDSRTTEGKKRRRRRCTNCDRRFTTYECVEMPELLVNKKDNTFEPFDKSKLIRGLSFAIKKRPVPSSAIVGIADEIESYCANHMLTQISTAEISDMVLKMLKKIDEVAYVRFASVNKDFSDVECFLSIISDMKKEDSDNIEEKASE